MLTFQPHIPLSLWLPLALAAAVMLGIYAAVSFRRMPRQRFAWIIGLMGVTLALPLAILLNPTWVQSVPPLPGKPLITVLVDRSSSMATTDGVGGQSRFAQAAEGAKRMASQLQQKYEIRVRLFDEGSAPAAEGFAELSPEGAVTNLAGAIEDALGEDRPQGQAVVLLTDGVDTSSAPGAALRRAAEKANALSSPLFVAAIGSREGVRDLEITLNLSQELAFVGQQVPVVVRLRHSHPLPRQTQLTLTRDGEMISTREVQLPAAGHAEEVLYISQPQSGLYRYQVAATPLADEVTELNNTATLLLRVVEEPVSVLLLEGKPYWDTKFLIRTLGADPSIELTSVVQMAPGRFLERHIARSPLAEPNAANAPAESPPVAIPSADDPSANQPANANEPAGADNANAPSGDVNRHVRGQWQIHADPQQFLANRDYLRRFQIVVLGRSTEQFLSDDAIRELRSWLQEGEGSLVCFRGSPSAQFDQRLGALMPVRWTAGRESRYRLEWTDSGAAMQWLPEAGRLSRMPSLAATSLPEEPKPLTTVLATGRGTSGEPIPLMSFRPEGNGRVVAVEGAGMWRWAFLPPEHQQHDAVYGTLWRNLVRWLISNVGLLPSEQLALRPDSVSFGATQPATATLLVRDVLAPPPQVEFYEQDTQDRRTVAPLPQDGAGGVYSVNFGVLPAGRYVARTLGQNDAAVAETTFDVVGNLKEQLEISARPEVLADLAARSGGGVLSQLEGEELDRVFHDYLARTRPERVVRAAAWDRWWVLAAVVGIWAGAWGVRRASGLV